MSDPRFARLKTDPRFRPSRKNHQKVVIDERFKSVFDQAKKGRDDAKPQVDKYGRKISRTHEEDSLERFYRLAEDGEDDIKTRDIQGMTKSIDYARGKVLLESSDEEGGQRAEDTEESSQNDADEILRLGGSDEELDIDLDEDIFAELDAQVSMYAKVNESLEEKEEKQDIGVANRTRRLAVVNLDWEYVRASHLYKIFSCLVSPTAPHVPVTTSQSVERPNPKKGKSRASPIARGTVVSVRVYPSEFGKARVAREEREGPPAEIFKKKGKDSEEINEKTVYEFGDGNEYNDDALRRYQLERLRYYYAIAECDTKEAASHIYNQLEGTELERSANVFDLSFVPEDMTFDDNPRDEATEDMSTNYYKPVDYVTNALRHSKVKLTWDEDDPERHQVTRRVLTRQEIDDGDFRAYIASSSEDEPGIGGEDKIRMDKDSSRQKLRAMLLSGNSDALPEGWDHGEEGSDVDMEITFTPGLSQKKDEETTLDKYQRKVREKRKKRKQERKESEKSTSEKKDSGGKIQNDGFFGSGSDEDDMSDRETPRISGENARKKEDQRQIFPPQKEATVRELSSPRNVQEEPKHFDMKMVIKAEKRRVRRSKKDRKDTHEQELQEDFTIDVNDVRFKALHEDHRFAIDPTSPHFKNTKSMKAFLLERRRKRAKGKERQETQLQTNNGFSDEGLEGLVESVKRKSQEAHGNGKRRRT